MARTVTGLLLAGFAIAAALIFATDLVRLLPGTAHAGSKPGAQAATWSQIQLLTQGRRSLPHRIDEVTVLESFAFDGTTLVYGYAVSGLPGDDVDLDALKSAGLPNSCKTLNDAYRPGEIEALRHHYAFAHGEVLDIDVSRLDCARAAAAKPPEASSPGNFITEIGKQVGVDFRV